MKIRNEKVEILDDVSVSKAIQGIEQLEGTDTQNNFLGLAKRCLSPFATKNRLNFVSECYSRQISVRG